MGVGHDARGMNAHGLAVLEYPDALAVVARYATSEPGREAVLALRPSDAAAWIDEELRRVEQTSSFLLRNEGWGMPAVPDLRRPLEELGAEGSVWAGTVLRDAGTLLRSSAYVRRTVLRYSEDYPRLADRLGDLIRLEKEEERLRRAIAEDGSVRDEASPELRRLRADVRSARSRIVEQLERYVARLPEKLRVPDASVSVRDGRYVVPVRREGRSEIGGIVHDESGSGATLFIEPPLAIELMNRIRELELAEAREVQRILTELTEMLRPHREALRATLDALVALDSWVARARYAVEANGHRPALLTGDGAGRGYEVVDGRHPLLLAAGGSVVPFSLAMEPAERTLLVSGPNTGGKTVLLKAMGLISALAQSGVVPPVGPGTRLPVFADFFADIGDEQSIEASLSTFSAHLRNLREVVEQADGRSMVLIDEVGSGTDPAEGAALARAILVELTGRGALTVATSHLGELKQLAGSQDGVVNASLQFDPERLRPTYRLVKGVPGRSYGLAIARRLGFPAALLERAEAEQPAAERNANELLAELERKERAAGAELARAREARRSAEQMRDQAVRRAAELERREKTAEKRAREDARALLLDARREVEEAIAAFRQAAERAGAAGAAGGAALEEAAREARRRIEDAARTQDEEAPAVPAQPRGSPEPVHAGDRVRVERTGATGTVVEVRDGRATVETRGLRMQVDTVELSVLPPEEARREEKRERAAAGTGGGWSAPEADPVQEVDLRGLRAHEVSGRLEPALDAALRGDLPSIRVIHGKGTGALRDVVTELLSGDPRVRSFRPGEFGEGGSGVTVVEL